jgi:kynurenine formamidase
MANTGTYLDSPFHRFADGRDGARFFAVPVKVKSFGTFPVRAFAKMDAERP